MNEKYTEKSNLNELVIMNTAVYETILYSLKHFLISISHFIFLVIKYVNNFILSILIQHLCLVNGHKPTEVIKNQVLLGVNWQRVYARFWTLHLVWKYFILWWDRKFTYNLTWLKGGSSRLQYHDIYTSILFI